MGLCRNCLSSTVGRAYSFVFTNLGLIYRLCWFPILVGSAVGYVHFVWLATVASQVPRAPGPLTLLAATGLVSPVAQLFFLSMMLVALHRAILFGKCRPGTVLLFSVGRRELLFMVVPAALPVGLFAIGLFATFVLGVTGGETARPSPVIGVVVILAILILGVWLACRFVALFPLVVVNGRLSIRPTFRLSRGNFWRILGVFFFGTLPIILAGIVSSLVLVPLMALFGPRAMGQGGAGNFAALAAKMGAVNATMSFIIGIPVLALGVAFLCYTYKALAGFAPDEVVPSEGHRR